MWTKRTNKERKRILRTQTTNAHATKEATAEVDLDREAKVEVILEVKTMDANKDNRQRSTVTRIALCTNAQNTSGKIALRIQKVRTSREVICTKYRTEEEVDSFL